MACSQQLLFDRANMEKQAGYTSWYQQCHCCPYGYHIDLDFVRYCESIGQQAERTGSIKRRKDRRRQRQSMEVLLGLEPPLLLSIEQLHQKAIEEETPIQIVKKSSNTVQDGLDEAVSDFERTLQRSNKLSNNLPDVTAVHESLHRVPSMSSMSSTSGSSMTVLPSTTDGAIRDYDVMSVESYGLNSSSLQNIREQMALSLERTKELEERIKELPALQAQLLSLKEENRRLLLQIKIDPNIINENRSSYTGASPYSRLRSHSLSHSSSFESINKRFITPAPRRDVGVTCSVLTRNVGVGHQYPNTKSVSTITLNGELNGDPYSDKWLNEKIKFLRNDNQTFSAVHNHVTTVVKPIVIAKHTQTILPRERKQASSQTLEKLKAQNDSFTQTLEIKKAYQNVAILASVLSTDASSEAVIQTNTLGCSDDTVDENICSKCSLDCQQDNLNTQFSSISLASLTVTRSKSFNLGDDKLNLRNKTIGCQYEPSNLHKACQYELKTHSKASQNDTKVVNRGIQYENFSISKNTDTKDLYISKKHVGCNTKAIKIDTADSGSNTIYTPEKTTPCSKCSKKEKEDSVIPSRIPRLHLQTTPTENRKFKRQDTYTKIPVAANDSSGLSGLDLDLKHDEQLLCASSFEQVKQSHTASKVPSSKNSANLNKLDQESTLSLPETDLCQSSSHSHRTKVSPSKEMQAAMKVLNDSLQKGHIKNLKNQLKNAINIIQQEWFKISSSIDANPLDVEDYLDCFEDISFDILCYIVNMVDVSGNTAMHYAVSHGNFDVVSILLDSKVCDINQPNTAGYTSVMLVSLAEMCSATHANVVKRLFQLADVNIRAKQHGQTALMLAVSHGRLDMVQMLLEAGADINIQDEDGSTALMCASEHGHIEIVKHFLCKPDCDSSITDVDGSTALKIAMEAGHRHIGVLLYAHERNLHGASQSSKAKRKSASPKNPSPPLSLRNSHRALTDGKQS